ncbi:MAG: hypothetical protein ACE5IW_01475 [bacterium]
MKTRSLLVTFLAFCSFAAPGLQAQELSNIPGAFVNIGFGARPLGMGGAFVALANDVHAVLWNPAGLGQLQRPEATFSFTKQFGLVPYTFAAFGGPISNSVHHGEAMLISGDSALREVTLVVALASTNYVFVPNLRLGGAFQLRLASFGSNDSEFEGQVTGNGIGLGFNLGIMYHISEEIAVGLTLNNLVNALRWSTSSSGNYYQNLPREIVLGFAYNRQKSFAVVVDYDLSLHGDREDILHVGIEKNVFQNFMVRSGVKQNMKFFTNANYTLGAGFLQSFPESIDFSFDVSYLFNEIGNTLRVSLGFRF